MPVPAWEDPALRLVTAFPRSTPGAWGLLRVSGLVFVTVRPATWEYLASTSFGQPTQLERDLLRYRAPAPCGER
jgi:hypothetical protein